MLKVGARVMHALDIQGIGGSGTVLAVLTDDGEPYAIVEWDVLKREGHLITRSAVYTIDLVEVG